MNGYARTDFARVIHTVGINTGILPPEPVQRSGQTVPIGKQPFTVLPFLQDIGNLDHRINGTDRKHVVVHDGTVPVINAGPVKHIPERGAEEAPFIREGFGIAQIFDRIRIHPLQEGLVSRVFIHVPGHEIPEKAPYRDNGFPCGRHLALDEGIFV
ncbi:MAG: hypothetical protein BWY09_02780 [Candidatus Hydrogenedentes bacterium ADurb.Bin179]|nr:MAG: hypothetical protein BWY09_02780 [Candidatus Hydrogenedentes bacterium ADurb.Bin179]